MPLNRISRILVATISILGVAAACDSESLPTDASGKANVDAVAGASAAARSTPAQFPSPDIGVELVDLSDVFRISENLTRAFVATGSTSGHTLCNATDAQNPGNIQLVTCGLREFEGQHGIIVSVFWFSEPVPGEDQVTVALYHEGARPFSAPVKADIG